MREQTVPQGFGVEPHPHWPPQASDVVLLPTRRITLTPFHSYPGHAATMTLLINGPNHQVSGFTIGILGWILCTTSMGLVEWRVWHMDDPTFFPTGVACVGMWRVCIYHHDTNTSIAKVCHLYTYDDDFLPFEIRSAQHLLLIASILGLLGRVFSIFALRNVYMGMPQKDNAYNPFLLSGMLNLIAALCITLAVLQNYYSIKNLQGIAFPPSFQVPFRPDTQESGNAALVASIAAFLMLLSGLFFLCYKSPPESKGYPAV
ncbi:claudin-34-like [Microcebus murinus]|uniref:claudin-34-like n=1 Tax=Microcebus murinus TaxID=30608 RepID=UPI003F6BFCEC